MAGSERLLSDREIATIIRRATELQEQSGEPPPGEGLSLEVVRGIAAEIGVQPHFVDQAAASVLDASRSRTASLVGGPLREKVATSYDRPLSVAETRDLVDRLREIVGEQGSLAESLGAVEWTAKGLSSTRVTITRGAEATEVQIAVDRSRSLEPTIAVPVMVGLMLAGGVVDGLQPGGAEALAILGSGATVGLGVARAYWSATTRSFRSKLHRLQAEVGRYMAQRDSVEREDATTRAGALDAG